MVVGFSTTYAISAYHHKREFEPRSWRDVLDITLCDEVCQWLATGWWISPGTPVNWPPRYSWNIVESGVKHHKPNQPKQIHNSPVGLKGKWVHCAHKKNPAYNSSNKRQFDRMVVDDPLQVNKVRLLSTNSPFPCGNQNTHPQSQFSSIWLCLC